MSSEQQNKIALRNENTMDLIYKQSINTDIQCLPLAMQQKYHQINSQLNIKRIMDINLSIKNISLSLNVHEKLLEEVDTQTNLIKPLESYRSNEKKFCRELKEIVGDLDNQVGRSIKFYEKENKETLDEYCEKLQAVTETVQQFEDASLDKKRKNYRSTIIESCEEHQEQSKKIEKQIKSFFDGLYDVSEQMEDANRGIQTFKTNVSGKKASTLETYTQIYKTFESQTKLIEDKQKALLDFEKQQKQAQNDLDKLKQMIQDNKKEVNNKSIMIGESNLNIDFKNKCIQLQESRMQETERLKEQMEKNQEKIKQKKQDLKEQLFLKKQSQDENLKRIQEIEREINQVNCEKEKKESDQKNSFFSIFNRQKIKKIGQLEKEKEKLKDDIKAEEESMKRYIQYLNDTIQAEINQIEEEVQKQNIKIKQLEDTKTNYQDTILSIQHEQKGLNDKKINAEYSQNFLEKEITRLDTEVKENKKKANEDKEQLEKDKGRLVELQVELDKAEKDMLECVKNLQQLERLDIPEEILKNFSNIKEYMNQFAQALTDNKASMKRCIQNFDEDYERFQNTSKKLNKISDSDEPQEDFKRFQLQVNNSLQNTKDTINEQINQYKVLNSLIKEKYYAILNYQDDQKKKISS